MNPFTTHPNEQGMTYGEHWYFAMTIACRLFSSARAFAIHAIVPFKSIDPQLDLEETAAYLADCNRLIEIMRSKPVASAKIRRPGDKSGAHVPEYAMH